MKGMGAVGFGVFGVTEYTLVFRRALRQRAGDGVARAVWTVARPITHLATSAEERRRDVSQVFVVPICSTLALDQAAYEQFLLRSRALTRALRILNRQAIGQPQAAENARKQIQSIVMAAEVNHIVARISA